MSAIDLLETLTVIRLWYVGLAETLITLLAIETYSTLTSVTKTADPFRLSTLCKLL